MRVNRFCLAMRTAIVLLAGAFVFACGEDEPYNPDNPTPTPDNPIPPSPPAPQTDDVVIHDYSQSDTSKVKVVSIDYSDEGNMLLTVEVPSNQIPKVGEFLVSGPTKLAPYGYLLRAVKVTEESGTKGGDVSIKEIKVLIEAITTTINELIKLINFTKVFYVPLPDVSFEMFQPILEGLKCTMQTSTDATGMENLPFDANGKWQRPANFDVSDGELELIPTEVAPDDGGEKKKGNKATVSFDAFEIDGIKIKPHFSFVQKGLFFYLEILEGTFQKFGVDYEANLSMSLEIVDTFKGKVDKKIPLGSLVQSYKVSIGEVPVVITVVCPLILELKVEGSIGFGFKPLDIDLDIGAGTYYDFPRKSYFPYWNHDKYVDIVDKTSQKEYSALGNMGSDMTLKGSISVDLSGGVSVGFYGCNVIDRKAGWMIDGKRPNGTSRTAAEKKLMKEFKDVLEAEFSVDAKAEISAKVDIGSMDEVAADLYIRDDCGLTLDWGGRLAASFKIPFVSSMIPPWVDKVVEKITPWNEKVQIGMITPSWDSPRGTFFDSSERKKWPHTLFFPGYSELKIEDGPPGRYEMAVSATKSKPLLQRFGLKPFKERNFGICIVPSDLKNEATGPFSQNWITYDLTDNPACSFNESEGWVDINEMIPKTDIQRNRDYDLFFYSVIEGPLLNDIYLFRADKQFRLSETGRVSTVNLDDVPGENL